MVLYEKGFSVVIIVDSGDLPTLCKTLPVWFKVCSVYNHGAELIIACRDEDLSELEQIIKSYEEKRLDNSAKVMYFSSMDKTGSLLNKCVELASAPFMLFTSGICYPNGDIFSSFSNDLGRDSMGNEPILWGDLDLIKAPYNYSLIIPAHKTVDTPYDVPSNDKDAWRDVNYMNVLIPKEIIIRTETGFSDCVGEKPQEVIRELCAFASNRLYDVEYQYTKYATMFAVNPRGTRNLSADSVDVLNFLSENPDIWAEWRTGDTWSSVSDLMSLNDRDEGDSDG